MEKQYIFIVNIKDCVGNEFELYSNDKLCPGVYDSYEAAGKAADELTLYKVVFTYRHYIDDDYDGDEYEVWEEEIDSFDGCGGCEGCLDDEPMIFFSYSAAESYAYCRVDDDEYEDEEGLIHRTHAMYSIVEMKDFTVDIVELTK